MRQILFSLVVLVLAGCSTYPQKPAAPAAGYDCPVNYDLGRREVPC